MISSSKPAPRATIEPTTAVPPYVDIDVVLPELSSPQERYDHGFKRGYLAGYAEGARQAEAERQAEISAQKAVWAATIARAGEVITHLAKATEEYLATFGQRDLGLTERLLGAAFEVAEAVVGAELRARPERALETARSLLAGMLTGPAVVKVAPADEALMFDAASTLGDRRCGVSVVVDPSLGPGDCIVISGGKTADARIESALSRAREVFCAPLAEPGQ